MMTRHDFTNATLNNTDAIVDENPYHEANNWSWPKIFLIHLFCLLIIVIIIGNTLVILAVITTRRLRTVTNLFVTSLAVADWFVGLLVMPPAVYKFSMGSWPLGWILCQFWISLDVLLCTASILSLCAISIDRYLAVTQPLSYSKRRRSKRLAMGMILIVWLMAVIITCPQLFWSDRKSRELNVECEYNSDKGYVIYSAFGSFFIPMSIMLYVYMRIFCVLSSRQSRISKTEAFERADTENEFVTSEIDTYYHQTTKEIANNSLLPETPQQPTTLYELLEYAKTRSILKGSSNNMHPSASRSNLSSSSGSNRNSFVIKPPNLVQFNQNHTLAAELNPSIKSKKIPIRISSLKRETKTAQTLSIVVVSFVVCWLPFFLHYIARPFMDDDSIWTNEILEQILLWLGWVNSSINPFIYAFYNNDFRIAFYRLTFRSCHRSQQNNIFK